MADLIDALSATSATIAFDAIGGGKLVSYILTAMEAAANASTRNIRDTGQRCTSKVYIYGVSTPAPRR